MLDLDGSRAGGQYVRSALALAVITSTPIRIENIRGARSRPGLRPQHLATLRLLTEMCDATATGTSVGSDTITFSPRELTGGSYTIDIETAGSIPLLLDTLLPLAPFLSSPLIVSAKGGTDVRWAPTMDYFQYVKLPLLRTLGVHTALTRHRTGFYPRGNGHATLFVYPSEPSPIDLTTRGDLIGARVYSTAAEKLAARDVADRQLTAVRDALSENTIPLIEAITRSVTTDSPGSAVCIRLDYEHTIAGFDVLGERGKTAESVGTDAAKAAIEFTAHPVPTDRYMADQLLVHLAYTGGQISISTRTDHVQTSIELLEAFGFSLSSHDTAPDHITISADRSPNVPTGVNG